MTYEQLRAHFVHLVRTLAQQGEHIDTIEFELCELIYEATEIVANELDDD